MNKIRSLEHQRVRSVVELLSESMLRIPEYQRPYKWKSHNISNLLNDIKAQSDKSAYRLGTIVLNSSHDDEGNPVLNIVDGQQRCLTLMLIVLAVNQYHPVMQSNNETDTSESIKKIKKTISKVAESVAELAETLNFSSDTSIYNLHNNFEEISSIVRRGELKLEHIDFLLNKCEVVIFILEDISEAFQFFDSQNSRGKDLYPHDLLKAFHLREFSDYDEQLNPNIKAQTVAYWEGLEDRDLHNLFSKHLFRIKRWIDKKPARHFTNRDVDIFKGVSLNKRDLPQYAKAILVLHHFVDDYNANMHRHIDNQKMPFPFQLDQKIVNGRRFFEMVEHYDVLVRQVKALNTPNKATTEDDLIYENKTAFNHYVLSKRANNIIYKLNSYEHRGRQGDKYVRNLFDNTLIYYIDKFGTQDLSAVLEIVFVWAYKVRLRRHAVKLATMDNYALEGDLFKRIKEATLTRDVWLAGIDSIKDDKVQDSNKNNKKDNTIYRLFDELHYLIKN